MASASARSTPQSSTRLRGALGYVNRPISLPRSAAGWPGTERLPEMPPIQQLWLTGSHNWSRAEVLQGALHGPATAMVQTMDRTLALPERSGDLSRGESDNVAQDQDLALVLGQELKRHSQISAALEGDLVVAVILPADLLARNGSAGSDVVEGCVACDSQDPGRKGNLPLLVLSDHVHQLGEDIMSDVLSLMMVLDEASDIAMDVVRVAHVEEMHGLHVAALRPLDSGCYEPAVARATIVGDGRTSTSCFSLSRPTAHP